MPRRRFVPTTSSTLPSRLRRRSEWSRESGFVAAMGSPPGCGSSPTDGTSRASTNTSRWRGDTSAVVTTSVSPAPARVSRISSRTSSGDGRYAGMPVWGVTDGTSS